MAIETLDTDTPTTAELDGVAPETPAPPVRSRRALLTAALGGLGGFFAARLGTPDAAAAATGDPLIIGNTSNNAGTANTSLATASAGTALLVTQNGSGTALRGSAVGAGSIAGFFTAQNGTGISGVTGNPNTYGAYAANNGAAGTGAALRAAGGNNDGVVATAAIGKYAVKAIVIGGNGTGAAVSANGGSNDPGVLAVSLNSWGVRASSTNYIGVYGDSTSQSGVHGLSSTGSGVRGDSTNGAGVFGSSTEYYGVQGVSTNSTGVRGTSTGSSGVLGHSTSGDGVLGESGSGAGVDGASSSGAGVLGQSNTGVGVYGVSTSGSAGFFEGLLNAYSVNAAIKAFRIDHPEDPANKVLEHSCVESNERLTVYAGTVTTDASGEAVIELPGYFDALNTNVRYQLTPLADARVWVKRKIAGNRFAIATSEPRTEVCWQVTGVRQDAYAKAHPLVIESAKKGKEQGRYLHPIEHGQPESKGVAHVLRKQAHKPAA